MTKKELLTRFVEAVRKQRQLKAEIFKMNDILCAELELGTYRVGDAVVRISEGGWNNTAKKMKVNAEVIDVPKEEFDE